MKKRLLLIPFLCTLMLSACGELASSSNQEISVVNGKDGASVLTGNGAPSTNLGKDGDSYIDLDTYDFYVKESGSWSKTGNIKGKDAPVYTEKYSVTWKNWDGTLLEIDDNVTYGSNPSYDGATPIKAKQGDYVFTFTGWSPSLEPVDSNVTYWAQYSSAIATYTVTWKNWDGTVLEEDDNVSSGSMPSYDGATPTKESSNPKTTFVFTGWSMELSPVYSDVTYIAQFREDQLYTVTWKNWDGTVLETDTQVRYGDDPTYDGETPTRPDEGETTYTFSHWVDANGSYPSNVYQDVVYTAVYTSDTKKYMVIFKDEDGNIFSNQSLAKGKTPTKPTPTKKDTTEGKCYILQGWYKEGDASKTPVTDFTVNGDVTYIALFEERDDVNIRLVTTLDGNQYGLVLGINDTSVKNVVIPKTYKGVAVTAIAAGAFQEGQITSITIPEGVTNIGDNAFFDCFSLTKVTLPSTLKSIGDYSFHYCTSMPSITLPDGLESIGAWAFQYCPSLTSITLPDSVTSIGENAFINCTSLTSITLPNSLTDISSYMFQDCSSLTSITLPDSLTHIRSYAFENCTSLGDIIIPSSVTNIESSAFRNTYCNFYLEASSDNGFSSNWKSGANGGVAYYSETSNTDGYHWHYDTDGKTPILWKD